MTKVDFKKTMPTYRAKLGDFSVITVPPLQYIMVDGRGDPNSSREFQDALEALYPVAYKMKFASKLELDKDYVVGPLEGLWWAENMESFTTVRDKSKWDWTVMLLTPEWVTKDMFRAALQKVSEKAVPTSLDKVRLETLDEGMCVQTLHIGSFDNEAPVLEKLHHEFIPGSGLKMTGKHHEIYFSDFRKTAPDKLRTILRQPVAKI